MPRKKSVATASPTLTAPPLLVNIRAAAQMLSSTVWSVRELLWAKKIPHVKIGRRFLIAPADLEAYVARLKAGA